MKRSIKIAAACVLLLGANGAFAQDDPNVDYVENPPVGIADVSAYGEDDNTNAGEVVSNTATVTYSVDDVPQNAEVNDPAAEFMVDRVILVTVASEGGINVSPEATGQALEFTVTNDSNDTLDFVLAASNVGAGDSFQADSVAIYQDDLVNGTDQGIYDAEDDLVSRLTDVAEGETITVFVVSTIPDVATVGDGDTADIVLLATAYNTAAEGGGIVTEDEGAANVIDEEDTVFGDVAGDYVDGVNDDVDEDGQHSATGTYTVATATITVTKSSTVISDPFNGESADAKAIPGAVVEYCILVTNGGGSSATDIAVSDPVPEFTTYVAESIQVADDCAGTNAVALDDDIVDETGDDDATGPRGSFTAANPGVDQGSISTTVDTLASGDPDPTTATIFRVTID